MVCECGYEEILEGKCLSQRRTGWYILTVSTEQQRINITYGGI